MPTAGIAILAKSCVIQESESSKNLGKDVPDRTGSTKTLEDGCGFFIEIMKFHVDRIL
jgi:hypothetical protein